MLVVSDVEASSRWYQDVLGLASGHGGDEYEMLLFDGDLVAAVTPEQFIATYEAGRAATSP